MRTDTSSPDRSAGGTTAGRRNGILGPLVVSLMLVLTVVAVAVTPSGAAAMVVTPDNPTVVCTGSYGSIGRLSGASAGETLTFSSSPPMTFLPAYTSNAGTYTVLWRCDPADAGTVWSVQVTGNSSGRSAAFTVRAGATPLPAAGTNLLPNAGFDAGASPWTVIDQTGATSLSVSATGARSGAAALVGSGPVEHGSIGQRLSLDSGQGNTFTLSAWVRHPYAGGDSQSASLVLETSGATLERSAVAVNVTEQWQRYDVTLSLAGAGHTGLVAKLVLHTPQSSDRGSYLLDDVSLVQSSPDPFGRLEATIGGNGTVTVRGYAIDPNVPTEQVPVVIVIGTGRTALSADVVRSDLVASYPAAGPVHGFDDVVNTSARGTWEVCAYARNLGMGNDALLGCSVATIANPVSSTTAPSTTATPTTATPATTASSGTTFVPGSFPDTSSIPEPLGPTIFEPVSISLFQASTLDQMVNAFDFTAADADILRLYWAFFLREAEPDGAKYWIGQSRRGLALDDIAWGFSESAEFRQRYGRVGDHQFLDIVYRNVLGRSYDSAGFAYWMSEIRRGLPRSGAVRWIAASNEFVLAHAYS